MRSAIGRWSPYDPCHHVVARRADVGVRPGCQRALAIERRSSELTAGASRSIQPRSASSISRTRSARRRCTGRRLPRSSSSSRSPRGRPRGATSTPRTACPRRNTAARTSMRPSISRSAAAPPTEIPLEQLVAPAVVIDVSRQAAADRDYRLTREDVAAFEKEHGAIPRGTIVLVRTGWSRHWPDAKAYLGDDTPGDASKLSFPELRRGGGEAVGGGPRRRGARHRHGLDRLRPVGRLPGPPHAAARNVPGLENLTNLDRLPARGAVVIALPMKIEGGSGGPLRAIALVPVEEMTGT